eukprot:g22371.t1
MTSLWLQDNVTKLTRGTVKLCQVVGVFPGARMNDGTEAELDVDVELLNWEDCAQNLVSRVDKTWRQLAFVFLILLTDRTRTLGNLCLDLQDMAFQDWMEIQWEGPYQLEGFPP